MQIRNNGRSITEEIPMSLRFWLICAPFLLLAVCVLDGSQALFKISGPIAMLITIPIVTTALVCWRLRANNTVLQRAHITRR